MITKETFCAALGQILEQREIDAKVGAALESVGDGHFVFGCKNRYLTALLLVLKEAVNDQYDYIDWWLKIRQIIRRRVLFVMFVSSD